MNEAGELTATEILSQTEEGQAIITATAERKPRRTREQIEQEKIEKAQARIEAIKLEQSKRRIKKALELMTEAFRALQPEDVERFTVDSIIEVKSLLETELAK